MSYEREVKACLRLMGECRERLAVGPVTDPERRLQHEIKWRQARVGLVQPVGVDSFGCSVFRTVESLVSTPLPGWLFVGAKIKPVETEVSRELRRLLGMRPPEVHEVFAVSELMCLIGPQAGETRWAGDTASLVRYWSPVEEVSATI